MINALKETLQKRLSGLRYCVVRSEFGGSVPTANVKVGL